MIAASKVDWSVLSYAAGAVVAAVFISALLALRHRRPRTIESDMESFSKGLRALAPDPDRQVRRQVPLDASEVIPELRPALRNRPVGRHFMPPGSSPAGGHDGTEVRSG